MQGLYIPDAYVHAKSKRDMSKGVLGKGMDLENTIKQKNFIHKPFVIRSCYRKKT